MRLSQPKERQKFQVSIDVDNDAFLECLESIRVSVPMSSPVFRSLLGFEREFPSSHCLSLGKITSENESSNKHPDDDYSDVTKECDGPCLTHCKQVEDTAVLIPEQGPAEDTGTSGMPTMHHDDTHRLKDSGGSTTNPNSLMTEFIQEESASTDSEITDDDGCFHNNSRLVSDNGFSYSLEEIDYLDSLAVLVVEYLAQSLALDFYPPESVESVFGIQQGNPRTPYRLADRDIGQVMLGSWRTLYINQPRSVFDKDKVIKALR